MPSVRPSPDARLTRQRPDAGPGVITDLRQGIYFSVNEMGCRIWLALSAGLDSDSLIQEIARQHGVAESAVRQDVDAFITLLRSHRLI